MAAGVVLVLAVGTAGCTAAAPDPPSRWPGTAALEQSRSDRGGGTIGLRLTAPQDAVVRRVRMDAGGGPVAWHGRLELAAGRTTTVQLPVPAPACPAGAAPVVRALVVTEGADGGRLRFAVRPADDYGAAARLAAEGCAQRAVARVVRVLVTGLEQRGSGRGATADLVVELTPTGRDGRVRLGDVSPTVLLRPPARAAAAWRLRTSISGTDPARTLRLPVEPARCDAHAIAEDKVGTVLPVEVATGSAGPNGAAAALPLAPGVRRALLRFVAERCGLGS